MIGICIELKTSCKHCSSPLMLNAFTEDILCNSCFKINSFPLNAWKSMIEDALKEAQKFKPGEGQPSTIMSGEYTYNFMYGRQDARCGKCKTGIDISKLEEFSAAGKTVCGKCGNEIFIRKAPDFIVSKFPGIKYLAGEDDDLLSENKAAGKLPASSKPVLFNCPSCAGNLEIDGTDRMVECKFCDSQIYLPDDLWHRLHPVKTVGRWYILYDAEKAFIPKTTGTAGKQNNTVNLPEWHYIADVTADSRGNIYIASSDDIDTGFMIWSITPKLQVRWINKDLNFKWDNTGITVAGDGSLYVWDKSKHSLLNLSSADGTVNNKIEGKPVTSENPYAFNLKGCTSLVSFPDGSLLALINNEIARFDSYGRRIELWSGKKFGLFKTGIGNSIPESDDKWAPYLKEIKSFPKRVNSGYTILNVGWDGCLYALDRSSSDGEIAKFDNDGTKLWSKYIPLKYKDCKPLADKNGNVYILGSTEESKTNLIRLNQYNFEFETLLKDIKEDGALNREDRLLLLPDGIIFVFKHYNIVKAFSPDLKMTYRSKKSEEEDTEVLENIKKKIENDEEFG